MLRVLVVEDSPPNMRLAVATLKEDEQRALAAGCDRYITKPVDREQLLAEIDAIAPRYNGHPRKYRGSSI
jgi:DNA-binding response OmpR family regulator